MLAYEILAFAPLLFKALLEYRNGSDSINKDAYTKKHFCILCGFLIFLTYALRHYGVGSGDSLRYYKVWMKLRDANWTDFASYMRLSRMEHGFLYFIWVVSHIFKNPQFIFVITGAIYAFTISNFIYKNVDYVLIGYEIFICVGMFTFMMQGMRQALAMCICIYSVEFIKKHRFISFLIVLQIAIQFHRTSIIFIMVYFLYHIRFSNPKFLVTAVIGVIFIVYSPRFVSTANELFEVDYSGVAESGGYIATLIYIISVVFGILYFRKTNKKKVLSEQKDKSFESLKLYNEKISFFVWSAIVGCILYIIRFVGVRAAQRLSYYFLFSQIGVLSNTLWAFDDKSRYNLRILITILCIALFLYRLPREGMTPYIFFWE